jgi:type II secretory pathway component PulK
MLLDALTLCGDFGPDTRIQAVTDWVDADDRGLRETPFYQKQTPPYRVSDRPLRSWSELLWVDGFNRAYFAHRDAQVARQAFNENPLDCVTLIPVARTQPIPVNVNTASRAVLTGVTGFGHDELVNTLMSMRAMRPIASLDGMLQLEDPEYWKALRPYLDVKSTLFRIEARSFLAGQAVDLRALARRTPEGDIQILQWLL